MEASDDGCEGAEEEPWNSLAISALQSAGFEGAEDVDDGVAGVVDGDVTFEDADRVVPAMTAPRATHFRSRSSITSYCEKADEEESKQHTKLSHYLKHELHTWADIEALAKLLHPRKVHVHVCSCLGDIK